MANLAINLRNKVKNNLMICEKCKKYMDPTTIVKNGKEIIKFNILSPIKMLNIVREIINEKGPKIDLDLLRTQYISFYWNCILYFYLTGLSFEMLLKYKKKDNENSSKGNRAKIFQKLQIERQNIII